MPTCILLYHGVIEKVKAPTLERNFTLLDDFRDDAALFSHFEKLSLHQLEEQINQKENSTALRVVITFDDAHASTLLAHEVLMESNIPYSVFVPVGNVGGMIWTIELALLLLHGPDHILDALNIKWDFKDSFARQNNYNIIRRRLKQLSSAERQECMAQIRAQYPPANEILACFPSVQMLTWPAIRELSAAGVDIGSHGIAHEIHHEQQPAVVRQQELILSKQMIETQISKPCMAFALPNGDWNAHTAEEIREAGYRLGFTIAGTLLQPGNSPYLLPRMSAAAFRRIAATFIG